MVRQWIVCSAKIQMRLLTESLHSTWKPDWPFVAFANVGLFYGVHIPPLVPDVLLSLNVRLPEDLTPKLNRSYFVWGYGKPPEVAIEIVSNKERGEDSEKLQRYADARVSNYFIYDPDRLTRNPGTAKDSEQHKTSAKRIRLHGLS